MSRAELNELVQHIKNLEIQGAKEIAITSLKFLQNYTKTTGFGKEFIDACNKLENARPTAVVLHNCLEILKKEPDKKTITKLLAKLNEATNKISKNGLQLIKDNFTILTHCHSGEALAMIKAAWKEGKRIKVYATQTEPRWQGIKTVKELAAQGINVTLITDSAIGFFMPEIDAVVVGSDAMREQGNVNKIGSYTIAIVAKQHKVPYYVAGNTLKLDKRKIFEIEERPASEIYSDLKALKGVKVRNPAFDITPWSFITRIITEKGVMTPGNIKRLLQ